MSDRASVSDRGDAAEQAWTAAAAAALRNAGRLPQDAADDAVWEALSRRTVDGVAIPPLGTPERAQTLPAIAAGAGAARGPEWDGWDVRALVADPDPAAAGQAALSNLEGGATSLWLRVGRGGTAPEDLATVLAGVQWDAAAVVLDGRGDQQATLAAGRAFGNLVGGGAAHPDGNLGFDGVGGAARGVLGGSQRPTADAFDALAETVTLAQALGVRAIVVDGTAIHDAGGGDVAEVAYTLACGVAYVRELAKLGLGIDEALGLIEFRYAATDQQFVTIAKLRAARVAWRRIAELSGASDAALTQHQHAVTSEPMLTRYDPWTNLLRTTIASFAAGAGGATAVTALPFDTPLGIPDEFGHRMARNISALLLGESHVGKVSDPAAGAYAVESMTTDVATAAWTAFGEIERAGGVMAALSDGSIAEQIAGVRAERDARIATRRQPITGVSEFPQPEEVLLDRRPRADSVNSWSSRYERLRDESMPQPVILATVGSTSAASARVLFTRNLLAAGGIRVVEPETDLTDALRDGPGGVVVIAGADADYVTGFAPLVDAAHAAGAGAIFVAGRPRAVLAAMPEGAVDGTFAVGDDMLALLGSVRAAMEDAR